MTSFIQVLFGETGKLSIELRMKKFSTQLGDMVLQLNKQIINMTTGTAKKEKLLEVTTQKMEQTGLSMKKMEPRYIFKVSITRLEANVLAHVLKIINLGILMHRATLWSLKFLLISMKKRLSQCAKRFLRMKFQV